MDKIFIENLRLAGKHGVQAHERRVEQEFLVDITAEFDAAKGAKSDKLKDTINYAWMRDVAKRIVEGESSYLIENLAEKIAEELLTEKRFANVTVTIRKPSVLPSGTPGVTLTRPS